VNSPVWKTAANSGYIGTNRGINGEVRNWSCDIIRCAGDISVHGTVH